MGLDGNQPPNIIDVLLLCLFLGRWEWVSEEVRNGQVLKDCSLLYQYA